MSRVILCLTVFCGDTLLFFVAAYAQITTSKGDFYFMDFLKILKVLTEANDLELSDICVMAVLTTYAQYNKDKSIEMSYSEINEEFKRLSMSTIKRSIKRLVANGYISITKSQTQKNIYKILIDIPEIKAKPIYQKKISNKIQSEDDYIAEAKRVALANPFLNGDTDE